MKEAPGSGSIPYGSHSAGSCGEDPPRCSPEAVPTLATASRSGWLRPKYDWDHSERATGGSHRITSRTDPSLPGHIPPPMVHELRKLVADRGRSDLKHREE